MGFCGEKKSMNVNLNMSSHGASFLVRQKHPLWQYSSFFVCQLKLFFNLHVSMGGERSSLRKLINCVCKSQHFKLKIDFIILLKHTFHWKTFFEKGLHSKFCRCHFMLPSNCAHKCFAKMVLYWNFEGAYCQILLKFMFSTFYWHLGRKLKMM